MRPLMKSRRSVVITPAIINSHPIIVHHHHRRTLTTTTTTTTTAPDPSQPQPPQPCFSPGSDTTALTTTLATLLPPNGRWRLTPSGTGIERPFKFKNFKKTWDFLTLTAHHAITHKHHPEWSHIYDVAWVRWTTHSPAGLARRDLKMARFCDEKARECGEQLLLMGTPVVMMEPVVTMEESGTEMKGKKPGKLMYRDKGREEIKDGEARMMLLMENVRVMQEEEQGGKGEGKEDLPVVR